MQKYALDDDVDGILGLGTMTSSSDQLSPFLLNAVQQGAIKNPMYSVWLAASGAHIGGTITYGDVDSEHCESDTNWITTFDGGLM